MMIYSKSKHVDVFIHTWLNKRVACLYYYYYYYYKETKYILAQPPAFWNTISHLRESYPSRALSKA